MFMSGSKSARRSHLTRVLESRYRDLVCLAYAVLDDGKTDEPELAARAHRAVWESATGGFVPRPGGDDETYVILRRRLLTRLLRDEPRAGRARRWFQRVTRPRMPEWLALSGMLPWRDSGLTGRARDGRAMVALAAIDGLTVTQARAVITAAFDGRDDIVQTPDDSQPVPGAERLRAALTGVDPSLLRSGPGRLTRYKRRRRALLSAGVVVLVIASYAAVITVWNDMAHSGDPVTGSLTQWRHPQGPETLADWPAEGNLAGDQPLLRSAAAAYRAAEGFDPSTPVRVLYAGDLSGTGPYVVLAADYGEEDVPPPEDPVGGYRPGLPIQHLGAFDSVDNSPYLVPLPGNRLLVPPWRTDLRLSWLVGGGSVPRSVPLRVADGIAAVSAAPDDPRICFGRVAAIQYRDATNGQSYAYTGTVIVAPDEGALASWPAVVMGDTGTENVSEVSLRALGDLTCGFGGASIDWLYQDTYQLEITDFGEQSLPGLGQVAVLSFEAQDASLRTPAFAENGAFTGGEAEFIQLDKGATIATGVAADPLLAGAWWHNAGRWYLLAAGSGTPHAVSAEPLNVVSRSKSLTIFSAVSATASSEPGPVLLWTPDHGNTDAIAVTYTG